MFLQTLVSVLKSRRFYGIFGVVLVAGIGIRMLPSDHRELVCETWQRLADIAFISQAAASEGPPVPDPSQDAFFEQAEQLFCPLAPPTPADREAAPGGALRAGLEVLPAALVIAVLITGLLPVATSRAEVRADAVEERDDIDRALQSNDTPSMARHLRQLSDDAVSLATRARQIRVAIVYAIGSCLATVLFPPDFGAHDFTGNPENLLHIAALFAAAAVAGAWGLQVFIGSRRPVHTLAAQVSFAGVFFAGLIALAIAIPYRMLNPVEGADLTVEQVRIFAAMRLMVIPGVAGLAGIAWFTGARLYRRRVSRGRVPVDVRAGSGAGT